jgi:hypothetical protein
VSAATADPPNHAGVERNRFLPGKQLNFFARCA